jgi:hypothetical protein
MQQDRTACQENGFSHSSNLNNQVKEDIEVTPLSGADALIIFKLLYNQLTEVLSFLERSAICGAHCHTRSEKNYSPIPNLT